MQVRAGVEMALIDAVANSIGVPLWRLFGGVSNILTTDITVQYLYDFNLVKLNNSAYTCCVYGLVCIIFI